MRAAIIIPARLSSTRLPRKLLLDATGMPLICHTAAQAALACQLAPTVFAEVVVATDDEAIRAAILSHFAPGEAPVRAVMTRPEHETGSDRVAEALLDLPDFIQVAVNVQGDEPEIDPRLVVDLEARLEGDETLDVVTAAYPIRDRAGFVDPSRVKVVTDTRGRALYFSRAPIPMDRDGDGPPAAAALGHVGIYAYRRAALKRFVDLPHGRLEKLERLEQLRALEHGMHVGVHPVEPEPSKGIDTEADYEAFVRRWRGV